MNTFVKLCNEIITAGRYVVDGYANNLVMLDMGEYYYGSACGDVALYRVRDRDSELRRILINIASDFSDELCEAELRLEYLISPLLSVSIYELNSDDRSKYAFCSTIFSDEELAHPHLNTNHNNREILHDYIRLVISKVEHLSDYIDKNSS